MAASARPVAMEPDLGGQEKRRTLHRRRGQLRVAMEPDLGGQEKPIPRGWGRQQVF